MEGRLIYVMGPSGSGKDSVIHEALKQMGPRACLARRVVTRAPMLNEDESVFVSEAEFVALERNGGLSMAWHANGYSYGILRDLDELLREGRDVFVNGSRQYLQNARQRYPSMVAVLMQVSPQMLRERLEARGRENAAQIDARLQRNQDWLTVHDDVSLHPMIHVDNSGALEITVQFLLARLGNLHLPAQHTEGKPCA